MYPIHMPSAFHRRIITLRSKKKKIMYMSGFSKEMKAFCVQELDFYLSSHNA